MKKKTKLPRNLSGQDLMKILAKMGFEKVGQRGSHVRMKRQRTSVSDRVRIVIVPMHNPLAVGTLRRKIDEAGLTVEEFLDLL